LENPPLGHRSRDAGDGQGVEEDSGEDRGLKAAATQLPKEWQTLALEKTGAVVYGIQAAVANNVEPIGTKILTNKNITLDGQFDLEKLNYFKLTTPRHKATILESGDILFNWRSGSIEHVGKTAIFRLPGEYVHSSFILRIRPFDTVSNDYLFYHLRFLQKSGYYARMHTYAINAKFNKSAVNALPVVLPPLPEQKKIAHILSTVQRAIEAQEWIIQTTTELKKALMHKLFTEGLRNEPLKQTEIGPVPESWEVLELGDVINLFAGYAFKSTEGVSESKTQLLRMGNLYQNTLDLNRSPIYYPDSFADTHKRFVLKEGDLVMSLTGTSGKEDYGFTVRIPKMDKTLLLNQRVTRIDVTDHCLQKDFAHHFLRK
jgi:restriction endonuclease S subunit